MCTKSCETQQISSNHKISCTSSKQVTNGVDTRFSEMLHVLAQCSPGARAIFNYTSKQLVRVSYDRYSSAFVGSVAKKANAIENKHEQGIFRALVWWFFGLVIVSWRIFAFSGVSMRCLTFLSSCFGAFWCFWLIFSKCRSISQRG